VIGRIGRKYGQSEIKFQIEVAEAVERIVKQHIFKDDELGGGVVLYNVGILFEPELHLDVVGLLKRISKNSLTVLMWPGSIDAQKLFFLDKNSEIKINQSDINYTII
jgi:methionine salvage enolase-phosphatase E1